MSDHDTDDGSSPTATEALYRLLVASVPDYAIFALDPEGHVLSWNAGAQRIKGYRPHEIVGRHFSVFYPAERIAEGFPAFELAEAAREGRFEDEGWRIRKDGGRFWANVVITALRDESGTLVAFGKVTRDLTERRAAEEQRLADARRVAAAEAANHAKSEFLTAMSHELRTPLNAIGGYADLLLARVYGDVSAEQEQALNRVRLSQQHLLSIISDLLNYTRIDGGKLTYDLRPFEVRELLDAVAAMVDPQALQRELVFDRGPCAPDVVARGDRARTEQILLNLLSNAIKFTPAGGRVTLWCARLEGRVVMRVRDSGPGIAAEHQGAIFEPFVQIGRALNRPHEGIGLGLAISRDLARAMGGDVTVASVPGEGATFSLVLPAG